METKNEKDAPKKVQDKKESWKIIKLKKPVSHMGMQIESLDLTGLDDMTLDSIFAPAFTLPGVKVLTTPRTAMLSCV